MRTLNDILGRFGKDKLNTLTKYPSIATLHKLGERGSLTHDLAVPEIPHNWFATEKIDGTNVRIIMLRGDYIIGSRDQLLYAQGDRFGDPAMGIVEGMHSRHVIEDVRWIANDYVLAMPRYTGSKETTPVELTVIYGEFYGGKVTAGSKNYGTDQVGFRVFDIAVFPNAIEVLDKPRESISLWREREVDGRIVYGQQFLQANEVDPFCRTFGLKMVPMVGFNHHGQWSVEDVYNGLSLRGATEVALGGNEAGKAEGVVIRTPDRSVILKARLEDYMKAMKR